jgi:putative DNA primase/helicase
MTDFGIAERFRDRHGADFRFTTAKGLAGLGRRRWKVLDQDKDTPPAELIAAAFETIRAIQREARRVARPGQAEADHGSASSRTSTSTIPTLARARLLDGGRKAVEAVLDRARGVGAAVRAVGQAGGDRALARRWLTVPIEEFDCEQMAVNASTARCGSRSSAARRKRKGAVRLDPHRREDLITKLAPVEYDREAQAPLYDGMIAWAQPDPAMRRYVHQVGGYACSGDTGEHKLWFNYGRGRNGKSTTIDSWCSALGDYSGTIGIESFLDQGIKKRGDAATPDLAKLGGVRMLRASEPERGAKLNSALIKAATGGEPMSVRALHRGFFDLLPRFKLLMSGNSKPSIPDTDEGIWGRMKLVPWLRNIEKPEDGRRELAEEGPQAARQDQGGRAAGVFARLVEGLVDYLEHGFVEPEG